MLLKEIRDMNQLQDSNYIKSKKISFLKIKSDLNTWISFNNYKFNRKFIRKGSQINKYTPKELNKWFRIKFK
jgi:hypothetical protein